MHKPAQTDDYNWMINKIFEERFAHLCQKYMRGKLIDIGCGEKPYKAILEELVTEHIGLDYEGTMHKKSNIDIMGTAYAIPVNDDFFDCAICTAVLEHLEEPESAIRECFRVLKPGGYAIYSTPFIWHLHEEPRDFFRYTRYGLQYLFDKVGFNVIELIPLSGFAVTFLQLHLYIVNGKFNKGLIKKIRLFKVYNFCFSRLGLWLNKYDRSHAWTWMYISVVQK